MILKLTLPTLALVTVIVLFGATGCAKQEPTDTSSASSPTASVAVSTMGPQASVAAPGDVGKIPDTTTVDGKTVTLKTLPSGVKYYDMVVGKGANPKNGQSVSVQYTGTLLDGTKFDSSYDHGGQPIDFPIGVGSVIKGWDEGVPSMKVGGKRRLVIPAALAYGANPPTPTIPANATLLFDIELVGIK